MLGDAQPANGRHKEGEGLFPLRILFNMGRMDLGGDVLWLVIKAICRRSLFLDSAPSTLSLVGRGNGLGPLVAISSG